MVIKQGGSEIGLVLAVLSVARAANSSFNIWSITRMETAIGGKFQKGLEKLQDAAQKKLESLW